MPEADLTFDVIFADQVRREDNGKLMVIGLYAIDMQLTGPPMAPLPLVALINVRGRPQVQLGRFAMQARLGNVIVADSEVPQSLLPQLLNPPIPGYATWAQRADAAGLAKTFMALQTHFHFVLPPVVQDDILTVHVDVGSGFEVAGMLLVSMSRQPLLAGSNT